MDRRTWRMIRFAALLVIIVIGLVASQRGDEPADPQQQPPRDATVEKTEPRAESSAAANTVIRNVAIRNLDGDIAYQGDVDLRQTLARISAGKRLRFQNDGSVFQNRERRLPQKPSGYYREWVHPTPDLAGPGPQRVVTGAEGEIYYTSDHYRTFQLLKE